jgi:hypothetical protein
VARPVRFRRRSSAISALLAAAAVVAGNTAQSDELRTHGVHQHGATRMNIALEPGVVAIELSGPMLNFAGFEHVPRNDEDRSRLQNAVAALRAPAQLFSFEPQGTCEAASVALEVPEFAEVDRATEAHHHDHQHTHPHGAREHDSAQHHDFIARYEFHCAVDAPATAIHARLFDLFSWTDTLEVQVIGPDLQLREVLTPQSRTLRMR